MKNIANKVVLVTGASSGIGEATARELAAAGARLMLGARRTDRLERLTAELGGKVAYRRLDVTDRADFEGFAASAEEHFGRVDVLVNNAGVMPLSPLAALKTDEWDRMIDVNVRGVLNGLAAVLPRFNAQGSGHVVNVASIGAHYSVPTGAVYCATKFAVWAITDGLRQETESIRTSIISPGVVATELGNDTTDETGMGLLDAFRANSLRPDAIARTIRFEIEQPGDVDVSEIIVRPTAGNTI